MGGCAHRAPSNLVLRDVHESLMQVYLPAKEDLIHSEKKLINKHIKASWYHAKTNPLVIKTLHFFAQRVSPITPDSISNYLNKMETSADKDLRQKAFAVRKLYLTLAYADTFSVKLAAIKLNQRKRGISKQIKDSTNLTLKGDCISHKRGPIDYLIVGSGPAGSLIARNIIQKDKQARVVLLDAGPFVKPGAIDTTLDSDFIESHNMRTTASGGIILRNARVVGGGATVNIDLAFSPLLPMVKERLSQWSDSHIFQKNLLHENHSDWRKLVRAYTYVTKVMGTRKVERLEINENNRLLLEGTPFATTYDLNQKVANKGYPILKNGAVEKLLIPALRQGRGRLVVIPDALVDQINFKMCKKKCTAEGVSLTIQSPGQRNEVLRNYNGLHLTTGKTYVIKAKNIILSAGTLGSAGILLRSKVRNRHIGRGIVLHPSMGVVGDFDTKINLHKGLSASVYAVGRNPQDNYFFESMGDVPSFLALIHPGQGTDILKMIRRFKNLGGFGVMLVDSPHPDNRIVLAEDSCKLDVHYTFSENDKVRFRKALSEAVGILFKQGAKNSFYSV